MDKLIEERIATDSIFEEYTGRPRKAIEALEGTEYSTGFYLDYTIGENLVKQYGPAHNLDEVRNFTLEVLNGSTVLLGLGANNLVLFGVELPDDSESVIGVKDLDDAIAQIDESKLLYNKVKVARYIGVILLGAVVLAAYYFSKTMF